MLYKNLPINTGPNNQYPLNEIILEAIHKRFIGITSYLSQCFIVRFDLHFPSSNAISPDPLKENQCLQAFWKKLVADKLKRGEDAHTHLEYFWVRELEKAKHGHYHCFIIFDRHKLDSIGSIQNHTGLFGLIESIWKRVSSGGTVHIPTLAINGLDVRQSYPKEKENAFYALSYLAKPRGKNTQPGVRAFGGSTPKKYNLAVSTPIPNIAI